MSCCLSVLCHVTRRASPSEHAHLNADLPGMRGVSSTCSITLCSKTQVQQTMKSIKALEASVHSPEELQPATKKAAQKLTNFRVSYSTMGSSGRVVAKKEKWNGPNVVEDVVKFEQQSFRKWLHTKCRSLYQQNHPACSFARTLRDTQHRPSCS